jgi:predicted ATPase
VIASVQFKRFKALRATSVRLGPFNLVIGPNGSGKTSLVQALLRLRTLARAPGPGPVDSGMAGPRRDGSPEIVFRFTPPDADIEVHLGCRSEQVCDLLQVRHADTDDARRRWEALRTRLGGIRAYRLDHYAMAAPVARTEGAELASNGHNLAAVLAVMHAERPETFARLEAEFRRVLPDFAAIETRAVGEGSVELGLRLIDGGELVTAENASQGALHTLAMLALSFASRPPSLLCLEEADRGIHPRLLREVRDALYRLSHPASVGEQREPVQIVATTHSPYLLDLFRDHPEEVVIAHKQGRNATFERLSDRADVREILAEGSLGDIWFSGILGGVPEDSGPAASSAKTPPDEA